MERGTKEWIGIMDRNKVGGGGGGEGWGIRGGGGEAEGGGLGGEGVFGED